MNFNVRNQSTEWAKMSYADGIERLSISQALRNKTYAILKPLELLDKPMDGYSCEDLPKTEENKVGKIPTYSAMFHETVCQDDFTPASYIVKIINESIKSGHKNSVIQGIVSRGMRSFASLLKEPDFASMLKNNLLDFDKTVEVKLNSKQDSKDHTDVLLECQGYTFRIWLYQFSKRGLPHDIERISGQRGELPDGIHLLCPLYTDQGLDYSAAEKSYRKFLAQSKDPSRKHKDEYYIEKIEKYATKMREIQALCQAEIKITNGWFFYADAYIQNVASIIINHIKSQIKALDYQIVRDTLLAPEKFIGNINMFQKGK